MANKTAAGSPTKEFFVDMLTRDIGLNDAILDLLDNCLDGVLRMKEKDDTHDFYAGYKVEIDITQQHFVIQDNCGGIPRDVAENKAFRMGRPSDSHQENKPTVGIYGIGMKRAIFKIGREAEVITKNHGQAFSVVIPSNWAEVDSWDFPIREDPVIPPFINEGGTVIRIEYLTEAVRDLWKNINKFVSDLIREIQLSYSLIIEKGFSIVVNGNLVKANPIELLLADTSDGIKPFVYINNFDGVKVKLAIGFYEPIPDDDEIDEIESRRSSSDAGWTIVCNDRVVLYNDKTFVTGWGEAGIPRYHTQFIGIKGIVFFESNDPSKLPMTTTKRGIDLSSPIYAAVKEEMRKGLKMFTNYTNRWKGRGREEKVYSANAKRVPVVKIVDDIGIQTSLGEFRSKQGASFFTPTLPKPEIDKNYIIIRFRRPREEVEYLSRVLLKEELSEVGASSVGEKCFNIVYRDQRGQGPVE